MKGVGFQSKVTEAFTKEEEDLWKSGALSTDRPTGLLCAVFFLFPKWEELLFAPGRGALRVEN